MKRDLVNKNGLFLVITAVMLALTFGLIQNIKAEESVSDLVKEQEKEKRELQEKIKALEEKARAYQQIIDIKQKQQESLANQIELIETESKKLNSEIEIKDRKIAEINRQIISLQDQILDKDRAIISQRKLLAELLQAFYEYSRSPDYLVVLNSRSLSGIVREKDRVTQLGEKIERIVSGINLLRKNLQDEKIAIEEKRKELTGLKIKQQEKVDELEVLKNRKEVLVSQTQGEENRYQQLLSRVERQKQLLLGDIDEMYSANSPEINKLLASLPRPESNLASTLWYYSQKDERWGNLKIGQSKSLVKDYGCALSSVAMVFTYHKQPITPGSLAKKSIYDWDLIYWPQSGNVIGLSDNIKLIKNTEHRGVNWKEIDNELKKNNPVIIFIKAKTSAGHYVVIHNKDSNGDYVVHDPYWGANIYLSSSIKLLSALYKTSISKSSIDQMVLYDEKE